MAGSVIQMYEIVEYFRGVEFKKHGPFEGEWQAQNYLDNLPLEDGVEYLLRQL